MANSILKPFGTLDRTATEILVSQMDHSSVNTIDFTNVDNINFASLRLLLTAREQDYRFFIVNANEAVAEKFEDTGVSSFVNVCRKPKTLDISKYQEFGASFLSKAYNSEDGDSMIKIYGSRVKKELVSQEKIVAREVFKFGIQTPLVGTLYENEDSVALDFERIPSKRSFSRIIADEPHRLEEISVLFAKKCKELHTKECNTKVFQDRTIYYRQSIVNCKELTDDEKIKAIEFVNSVPRKTTCLHGDMQLSNIIMTDNGVMWIDLSDFGYGNPMFDMGMWYFQARMNTEEIAQHLYHFGLDTLKKVWDVFIKEYFGADTPEKAQKVDNQLSKFGALHMLYLGTEYGFEPHMMPFIRKTLF